MVADGDLHTTLVLHPEQALGQHLQYLQTQQL